MGYPVETVFAQQIKQTLVRRHRQERWFKACGLVSVLFGFLMVVVVFSDITMKALPAFEQHWVKLDIVFSEQYLGLADSEPPDYANGNYRHLIRMNLSTMIPETMSQQQQRDLSKLLSTDTEFILRDTLLKHPSLLNQSIALWVMLDDDADQYLKSLDGPRGQFDRLNSHQIQWLIQLSASGRIESRFNWHFFNNTDSSEPQLAGIKGAVLGTLWTMLVTLLLSFPLGVAAAVYLEEFALKNRLTDIIEININNLAAVPSIIFGLLGLAVFINWFGLPRSTSLVGGIVLTLMTMPTIIIVSRNAIRAVPTSIREAAMSLGASQMQVAFGHVLPVAMPSILTGSIIGLAQALGETAPLLMIGMVAFIVDLPNGITDAASALPVQVYLWANAPEQAFLAKTSAAILVLLAILVVMNVSVAVLRRYFQINEKS